MRTKKIHPHFLLIGLFFWSSLGCHLSKKSQLHSRNRNYSISNIKSIPINSTITLDANNGGSTDILATYRIAIDSIMKLEIGNTSSELKKSKPNGTLGNMVADAMVWNLKSSAPVDAAVVNYGGIRIPSLSAGKISLGNVYEIMPFDNLIAVLALNAEELTQLCHKIAASGGWPVSGVSFTIQDTLATQILVNGQPLSNSRKYRIAMSDYIANGGDKCDFLKKIPQENTTLLVRDAIAAYIKFCNKNNTELIQSPIERIKK